MSKKIADMTDEDFTVEMLTLQFIQGKAADSALEYVKLYRQAKEEIKSAYKEAKGTKRFDLGPLIT